MQWVGGMEDNHFEFAKLKASRIIKDETALVPQNLEEEFSCRKDIEEKIITAIKPLTEGKQGRNVFIYGPSGSGKTSLIKHVLDQVKEHCKKVKCIYVNCWEYNSSVAIYTQVADGLGEKVSRRGRACDEHFNRIKEIMSQSKIPVLIVFDELDGLLSKSDTRILHNISRLGNNRVLFGVIGISEDRNILSKLPVKISSSLRFEHMEVKGHCKEYLFQLLKNRAENGLMGGSYDLPLLERIADFESNNSGNGNLAIEILLRAAKNAEEKGISNITVEDVEESLNHFDYSEPSLNMVDKIILDILKSGEKSWSEFAWLFSGKLMRSRKQIRTYLEQLEKRGLISIKKSQHGTKEHFKFIQLRR